MTWDPSFKGYDFLYDRMHGKTAVAARVDAETGQPAGTEATDGTAVATTEDGFSFWDLLDIVNPLQHIPVVGTLYRELTGDQLGNVARMAGGFLFGGPIALAAAAVNTVVDEATGKDIEEHVIALFGGDDEAAGETAVATSRPESVPTLDQAAAEVDTAAAAAAPLGLPAPGGPAPIRGRVDVVSPAPVEVVPPPAELPLGLLPMAATPAPAPAKPTASAAPPATPVPSQLERAMAAQGLVPATSLIQAQAQAQVQTQARTPPQSPAQPVARSAGTPESSAPVSVPSWFDGAMMQALDAYQKTGRLPATES